jgi:hypothetical protein
MKFIWFIIAIVAYFRGVSAQQLMPLAGAAFAFGAPFRVAYPGATNGFTAKIDVSFASGTNRPLPIVLRELGTRISAEIKFGDFMPSPNARREAQTLGIDELLVVIDTEKTNILFLFPKLQAFLQLDPPADLADAIRQTGRIHLDKIDLGTEWLDGSWCAKARFPDPSSPKVTATMWQRLDLHNFPVKIELGSKGDVMRIATKSVDFSKPSGMYFEASPDFKRCANAAELMAFAKKSSDQSTP